jgi:hypothetical protein
MTNTYILYQNFQYVFKDTDVRLSKTLGYCHDCDCLSLIEDFENIDYDLEQIVDRSEEAIKKAKRVCSINLTPAMSERNASPIRDLTSYAYYFAIALKRKGDERCLRCLNGNVIKFDGDMSIPYSRAAYFEGSKKTGFRHPGCGGEYIVTESETRFILGRQPRYFNISDDWQISEVAD